MKCCVILSLLALLSQAAEPPFAAMPAEWREQSSTLRSPLLRDDGSRVTSPEEWQQQREVILKRWHGLMGPWPEVIEKPAMVVHQEVTREGVIQQAVNVELARGQVSAGYLLLPKGE
jgi:hypothetical protein